MPGALLLAGCGGLNPVPAHPLAAEAGVEPACYPGGMLRIALAALLALILAAPAPAHAFDWIGKIQIDADGLESDDPQVRLQAVQSLQQYAIEWTAPHLLGALRDPDPAVRSAAGRFLGRNGVVRAAPVVIRWLSDPDPQIVQVAAEILGDLGAEEAVPALVRSLGDPDPAVRIRAVVALGTIGTPEVVVPLVARLEDDKSDVRRAAVEQLVALGDPRAVIPLVGVFDDSSLEVRTAAITAVGRLGDPAAVPALLRLLRDPLEEVRAAAITALGNLRATEASGVLLEMLAAGTSAQRAKIAFALGQIAGATQDQAVAERALETLVAGLADGQIRAASREALLEAGDRAVPPLLRHLAGDIEGDPATAVSLLREIGDPRATPALVRELDRGRLDRELVLDALGEAGDQRALIPILALLSDPDPAVRLRALAALRPMLAGDAGRAADVLVDLLGDADLEVRVLAAEYLGRIGAAVAVPRLLELATSADERRLRAVALDALGRIGDPRALPLFLDTLGATDDLLRRLAADALIRLDDDAAIEPLLARATSAPAGARAEAVRALGGVLRDQRHEQASRALSALASEAPLEVSLAAIEALGAMGDPAAAKPLLALATRGQGDRQRAALSALGDLPATEAARSLLRRRLGARDDRIAAAAAWALGKLGDRGAVPALRRALARDGFATPVNAAAALALIAGPDDAAAVQAMLHHRSRLVRANATAAARRLRLGAARGDLERLLASDPSALVRRGAARALARLGGADEALARAAETDAAESVRQAARGDAAAPPERGEWRSFYVVDPSDDDAPVEQEPYFLAASDGLVTAHYTDARGLVGEERFPAGDHVFAPASAVSRH